MATDLVEIDPETPQPEVLERAAAAIRRGQVVAIPTDALYTLVADPFNLRAVTQVFDAKGREPHRSLPILVRDMLMAEELAERAEQPLLSAGAPLLAGPADHHRAGLGPGAAEGHRQYRPPGAAPVALAGRQPACGPH